MRQCLFCNSQELTKEDAWPLWLMRLLSFAKTGTMEANRGGETLEAWHCRSPEQKVKYVCAQCNNGWMSQLEERVKPIVESLFYTELVMLDTYNQTTLAIWSVKNAMVFEAFRSKQSWFYQKSQRKALKESHQITPRTYVWIAKCITHYGVFCEALDLNGIADLVEEPVQGYATTMGFGSLVIQVLSVNLMGSTDSTIPIVLDKLPGPWEQLLLSIWPPQLEQVIWPATIGLNGEVGLEALGRRWSSPHKE